MHILRYMSCRREMTSLLALAARVDGINEGSLAEKRSMRCRAMESLSGMLPTSGVTRRGKRPRGLRAAGGITWQKRPMGVSRECRDACVLFACLQVRRVLAAVCICVSVE